MIDTDKYKGHTEGPWEADLDDEGKRWVDAYDDKGDINLCRITNGNKADAQLIADAPLLLAEVKRLRGVIYDALYVLQTDGWNKNRADAINRLEKILFKGWEGEEE